MDGKHQAVSGTERFRLSNVDFEFNFQKWKADRIVKHAVLKVHNVFCASLYRFPFAIFRHTVKIESILRQRHDIVLPFITVATYC